MSDDSVGRIILSDPNTEHSFSREGTDKIVRPTGFTRVRARSQGVCFSPRLAEADKLAVTMAPGVETSCSALRRGGSGLIRELSVSLDEPPCSTLPTLLAGPPRSCNRRTPQPNRRTPLAAFTVSRAARASDPRRVSEHTDGHTRPSSAFEQVATLCTATTPDIATSSRTRRTQRVLHEERNARQRPAAGRESHRHH